MSLARVIGPDIEELIREDPSQLPAALSTLHAADIAELLDDLPRPDRVTVFESLPAKQGAAVFSELKGETLRLILHQASPATLGVRAANAQVSGVCVAGTPVLDGSSEAAGLTIVRRLTPTWLLASPTS